MDTESVDAESRVSGDQANIPAHIRRELDIDDGDTLRWHVEENGTLRVRVLNSGARSVTSTATTATGRR